MNVKKTKSSKKNVLKITMSMTEMHKGTVYPIRTTQSMKKVYEDASNMRTAAEADKHLHGHGLWGILVSATLTWSNAHLP